MAGTTRSMVLVKPREMEMREYPLPAIGPQGMLLKVEMCGICGGEPKKYTGESTWNPPYPIILGHEVVGFVQEVGEEAAKRYQVAPGDRVTVEPYMGCGFCEFCSAGYYQLCTSQRVYGTSDCADNPPHLWGAYGQHLYVSWGSRVHKIDTGVPAEAAHLSSVIGNGIRWVRTKAQVKYGQPVVIIGPGAQGLSATISCVEAGARPIVVVGVGSDKKRLALAREFGAHHTLVVGEVDVIESVRDITGGKMPPVVLECSGTAPGIDLALELVRPTGRLVMAGVPHGVRVPLLLHKVPLKEITITGGLGQLYAEVADAVKIINSRRYPVEKIATHVFPLEKADEGMRFFMSKDPECIRVALKP